MSQQNYKMYCPFCGKDITLNHSYDKRIHQEETMRRDFAPGANLGGNYLKVTKYIRHYDVYCCDDCYHEYTQNEKLVEKICTYTTPIGFLSGIAFSIYRMIITHHEFGIDSIIACVLCAFLGLFIFSIPVLILNLIHRKKTSYKNARACNANIG